MMAVMMASTTIMATTWKTMLAMMTAPMPMTTRATMTATTMVVTTR